MIGLVAKERKAEFLSSLIFKHYALKIETSIATAKLKQ